MENYWVVNKEASADDIRATLDFMNWLVTTDEGTTFMADDLGLTIPFKDAKPSPNIFVQEDIKLTEEGKTPVSRTSQPCLPKNGRTLWVLL